MINTTDYQWIQTLNSTATLLNRYLSLIIFIFGVVGNILNCLVLSTPKLRKNPSALLFLLSSFSSLIAIVAGLTSRMLSGWAADLTNTNHALCKTRAIVLLVSRSTAIWLIAMAAIDRWMLSSLNQQIRAKSSIKTVIRLVIIVIFISIGCYSQMLYCYEANLTNTLLKCYGKTEACRFVTDFIYVTVSVATPIVCMMVFGILTVINIRSSSRRVLNSQTSSTERSAYNQYQTKQWKRIDNHLLVMILAQTVLLTIFTLPQAIQKLYSTITEDIPKSSLQNAVENFIFNLFLLSTYFSNGITFYMYTLCGGSVFRQAILDIAPKCRISSM